MLKLFLIMAIHGQVVASVEAVQSPTSPSSCWSEAAEKSMELDRALLGGGTMTYKGESFGRADIVIECRYVNMLEMPFTPKDFTLKD